VQKLLHEMINGPSASAASAPAAMTATPPPLLTPLATFAPPELAFEPAPAPRRTPIRHAGVLREYGGVVAWMRAQERGESVG